MCIWIDEDVESTYVILLNLMRGQTVVASTDIPIASLLDHPHPHEQTMRCALSKAIVSNGAQLSQLKNRDGDGDCDGDGQCILEVKLSIRTRQDVEDELLKKLLRDYDEDNKGSLTGKPCHPHLHPHLYLQQRVNFWNS